MFIGPNISNGNNKNNGRDVTLQRRQTTGRRKGVFLFDYLFVCLLVLACMCVFVLCVSWGMLSVHVCVSKCACVCTCVGGGEGGL